MYSYRHEIFSSLIGDWKFIKRKQKTQLITYNDEIRCNETSRITDNDSQSFVTLFSHTSRCEAPLVFFPLEYT
uniref:Uncharacterized protein n=1 Tax=Arundo donax TaxID=35708 RepID=A0A0A9BV21_ARUDO